MIDDDPGTQASRAATAAVLDALGLLGPETLKPLANWRPPQGRGDKTWLRWIDGSSDILVDSSYNASPTTVGDAIQAFGKISVIRDRILVLGDMLELGDDSQQLHLGLRNVIDRNANVVFMTGKMMKGLFDVLPDKFLKNDSVWSPTIDHLIEHMIARLQVTHGGNAILVKGSNGMGMGQAADALKRQAFFAKEV
jgi:UDP-N-acetylmuramoyl-tripeptide--D-alanyl-D-alanine ligase